MILGVSSSSTPSATNAPWTNGSQSSPPCWPGSCKGTATTDEIGDPKHHLYDYSAIVDRPRLEWPDGKRLAFYVGLNIEHYLVDRPAAGNISDATAGMVPDPMNQGWRDYGNRVGLWRMVEVFDELGIRPSVLINSAACRAYPKIVDTGRARGWSWVAHGLTNSLLHHGLERDQERAMLKRMVAEIEAATGTRPKGWLGPVLTETWTTPELLAELGFRYLLDWCCDDQPFATKIPGLLSIPYSTEINDGTCFLTRAMDGAAYERAVMDTFEQLLADSEVTGRVMSLPVHPFIVGQPHRIKYLRRVVESVAGVKEVWVTTSDQIAEYFAVTSLAIRSDLSVPTWRKAVAMLADKV